MFPDGNATPWLFAKPGPSRCVRADRPRDPVGVRVEDEVPFTVEDMRVRVRQQRREPLRGGDGRRRIIAAVPDLYARRQLAEGGGRSPEVSGDVGEDRAGRVR